VRVVVIDRNAQLLERIERELTAVGMAVETLDSTLGLTPELLNLSAPDVLLLDSQLPGLPQDVIPVIFDDLRKRRQVRCMLVHEGTGPEVAAAAHLARADAGVPRQALLQVGARALKESATPPRALPPPQPELELADDDDPLGHVPTVRRVGQAEGATAPRLAPQPTWKPLVVASPPVPQSLLALIEEELIRAPAPPPASGSHFDVSLDLFSEHQLYVGRDNKLSSGGIFVATALPPNVGAKVTLSLVVFRKVRAEVEGTVMWSTPRRVGNRQAGGCGVRLDGAMSPDLQRALERLAEERRPLVWTL
jgi:Tfp pilus assembly protein PilZ